MVSMQQLPTVSYMETLLGVTEVSRGCYNHPARPAVACISSQPFNPGGTL